MSLESGPFQGPGRHQRVFRRCLSPGEAEKEATIIGREYEGRLVRQKRDDKVDVAELGHGVSSSTPPNIGMFHSCRCVIKPSLLIDELSRSLSIKIATSPRPRADRPAQPTQG